MNIPKNHLWLWLPFVVVVCAGYFIIPSNTFVQELVAFGIMSLSISILSVFFKDWRIYSLVKVLGYVFLAFFAFVKLSFYNQYGVPISSSALYVIFETNSGEASDYLSNYFNGTTYLLLILLLWPIFFLLKGLFRKNKFQEKPLKRAFLYKLFLLLAALGCVFAIHKKFKTENIPYATLTTWDDYLTAKKQLKDALAIPTSKAFTKIESKDIPQTYVVVIGESTSRWHMQLYGYGRETNPKLTEIKEELVVMDSVITPHVHTITALEKILTLSNQENKAPSPNGSIIQLANMAGFTTYWLSNQKPVGLYESIPTIIGSAATHKRFMATDDYNYDIYDGALLPVLAEILKDKSASKKVIFVHLIGTHLRYEKRYPKMFEKFQTPSKDLKFQHEKAIIQTNRYDNAMLYNDYVIRALIEQLRRQDGYSYLAYFSDHGDEVYDTMDFLGHNEYHGTRPMFEVPLLFWFSEKYINEKGSIPKDIGNRKYSLIDFPHTFASLSTITFKGFDASKNVLDSTFVQRKRIIKDSLDYDKR
ncbi:sulfatase-like hydrolase/transferase [Rasiella sp. SM2506]|uniref:sulfatase-like hydrolase/transferase n=1 Tax=Rasiella sp. SM2506 TaxID=3423914 RepID=UPI003D79302E